MDDNQPHLTNFVSEDSVVTGGILSREDLEVMGSVEGTVRCNARVYIRDGAIICGPIYAQEIYVEGLVQGPIHAYRRAHILPRGVVIGDVYGSSLIIDAGGQHQGKLCRPRIAAPHPAPMPTPAPLTATEPESPPQKRLPRRFALSSPGAGVLKSSRTSICGEISISSAPRSAPPSRKGAGRNRSTTSPNYWPEPWPSPDSPRNNG